MTCLNSTDGKEWICRADGHWKDTEQTWERWCFGCRKRRLFVWRVFIPDPMSYYGPYGDWFCPNRDEKKWVDHTDLFPGMERVYEE